MHLCSCVMMDRWNDPFMLGIKVSTTFLKIFTCKILGILVHGDNTLSCNCPLVTDAARAALIYHSCISACPFSSAMTSTPVTVRKLATWSILFLYLLCARGHFYTLSYSLFAKKMITIQIKFTIFNL